MWDQEDSDTLPPVRSPQRRVTGPNQSSLTEVLAHLERVEEEEIAEIVRREIGRPLPAKISNS